MAWLLWRDVGLRCEAELILDGSGGAWQEWLGKSPLCVAWRRSARQGQERQDRLCNAWLGGEALCMARNGRAGQEGKAGRGLALHRTARIGKAWQGGLGEALRGKAVLGSSRQGSARPSKAVTEREERPDADMPGGLWR